VFTQSEEPEEIILAILADFKKEDKSKVVQSILTCLKNKVKNKKKLQKLIFQLEILSNLRSLQTEITKQIANMSIDYDVTKDLRYLQGEEVGEARGTAIGEARGEARGKDKTRKEVVINGYKNGISIALLSNISNLSEAQVTQILKDNNLI
jgi:hypothetical protein